MTWTSNLRFNAGEGIDANKIEDLYDNSLEMLLESQFDGVGVRAENVAFSASTTKKISWASEFNPNSWSISGTQVIVPANVSLVKVDYNWFLENPSLGNFTVQVLKNNAAFDGMSWFTGQEFQGHSSGTSIISVSASDTIELSFNFAAIETMTKVFLSVYRIKR